MRYKAIFFKTWRNFSQVYLFQHHRFFRHIFQSAIQTITLFNVNNKKPLFKVAFYWIKTMN
jgi:hypothetical protein